MLATAVVMVVLAAASTTRHARPMQFVLHARTYTNTHTHAHAHARTNTRANVVSKATRNEFGANPILCVIYSQIRIFYDGNCWGRINHFQSRTRETSNPNMYFDVLLFSLLLLLLLLLLVVMILFFIFNDSIEVSRTVCKHHTYTRLLL